MSFIEGIGDEVVAFFVVVIVLALATIVTFIGGESAYQSSTPTHVHSVQIESYQQLVDVPPPGEQNTGGSNSNESPPQPPDIGFREEVLTDSMIHPSAPPGGNTEAEESDTSTSDDGNLASNSEFPDSPEADLPQNEHTVQGANEIRVRLKYLDDTERVVRTDPKITVRAFKMQHFQEELSSNRTVRLIFCGHLLRDDSTLESYRVLDNTVLHVQILQPQAEGTRTTMSQGPQELDIGYMMWPLFAIILVLAWFAFYRFPEHFTSLSTGMLFLFTGGFIFSYTTRQ